MLLALRSGIDSEIDWALARLVRLAHMDKFLLKSIPGILDELFVWPDWYVDNWDNNDGNAFLFSPDPGLARKRRRALDSLLVLRNTSLNDTNAQQLAGHRRTRGLVSKALRNLDRTRDSNAEFLLHVLDLLFSISSNLVVVGSGANNPIKPLEDIAFTSNNRALIIASLQTLTLILSNTQNSSNLSPTSPALTAALRYLPLFQDKALLSASLEFLHAHLSNQAMTKAFLMHPELAGTLRVLAALLIAEQDQEAVSVDVEQPQSDEEEVGDTSSPRKFVELSGDALTTLAAKDEPERSYEWMRTMLKVSPKQEMTQVEFWTLYQATFLPFAATHPLLTAADVIKNATVVFPQAQPIAYPTEPPKFVIRGISRKPAPAPTRDQFQCLWNQSTCPEPAFDGPSSLYAHVRDHIALLPTDATRCPWSTCGAALSAGRLPAHIMTHLPSSSPAPTVPGQREMTVPLLKTQSGAVRKRLPPAPKMTFAYQRPKANAEPPSTSLTALLILRVLFRTAFVSDDAVTRADEDHFGFPGLIEDDDPAAVAEVDDTPAGAERVKRDLVGERRGRAAFVGVRAMLASVQFADPILQDWVTEMADLTLGDVEVDEDVV
ncbi:hypothetical protein EXIGLDRAFT_668964 [Exidia glandulosa HHB12029]|uniref:RFX-type winged-helix domain-containing protein n=1 Tax=Exidia glandulosa HHB12029 TaxID=1314781 RepID=A0A165MBM5_EXIGL|nr:hypothetical protein EXIGLDRAFT_668964 [Exidia glandulosa HHB12029]